MKERLRWSPRNLVRGGARYRAAAAARQRDGTVQSWGAAGRRLLASCEARRATDTPWCSAPPSPSQATPRPVKPKARARVKAVQCARFWACQAVHHMLQAVRMPAHGPAASSSAAAGPGGPCCPDPPWPLSRAARAWQGRYSRWHRRTTHPCRGRIGGLQWETSRWSRTATLPCDPQGCSGWLPPWPTRCANAPV